MNVFVFQFYIMVGMTIPHKCKAIKICISQISNPYQVYIDVHPVFQKVGAQDLSKRTYLKKKAKYDMSWYLKNVYPELLDTIPNRNSYAFGGVRVYRLSHSNSAPTISLQTSLC